MCRMIAKASVAKTSLMSEMMTCPQSLHYLSTQGRLPKNPEQRGNHKDGCGIAFISDTKLELHKRGSKDAWDESYINVASRAKSNLFIAHNRLASEGLEAVAEGSHPFQLQAQGTNYAFSHNGTVYDWVNEANQNGTTDSFLLLQKLISQTENNSDEQIIKRLSEISTQCDYSSITGFLLSQDKLRVWRVFNENKVSKQADYNLYYTLYMKLHPDAIVISSEP